MIDYKVPPARLVMFVATGLLCLSSSQLAWGEKPQSETPIPKEQGERIFTLRVLPLLKVKCFGCHGNDPKDVRGDFDIRSKATAFKGGESEEPSIVPGKPQESPLYQSVMWDGLEMPPKENDRLTKTETEYVRRWIAAGAPWPDAATQRAIQKKEWAVRENEDGIIVDTSGGLAEDWTYRRYRREDIWAFQPVKKFELEKLNVAKQNPVDFFIERKIKEAGIEAAPAADFRTLIRRASYDVTGLPPSPFEVFQFSKAWEKDKQQAWNDLVDRLLKSEHYGERWAQHWLDVVRYADTAGFSNDYERSNAWRYRDYVIRSFNQDKPFKEFIVEQIAGDELRPDDPEAIIATGFLRMGPWGTAMIPQKEARQLYLDDLVHNVGQSFLSLPMRCCKCHDHKFDPLPTRDYYSMYAAFATTQPAEIKAAFLPEENRNGFEAKRKLTQELQEFATAQFNRVHQKQEVAAKVWYAENNLPYKNEQARRKDAEDKKPPRHVGLSPMEKGILKVRMQDVWIWTRRLERYQPLAQAVYSGQDDFKNSRKLRPSKKVNHKWRPESFIFGGGAIEAPVQPVKPGVPSAAGLAVNSTSTNPWEVTSDLQGRRLELAQWIANDKNPLTPRSIVNRVWQHHFGNGLVKTVNNFGAKGSKPTHPDLLDWLTVDFIEHGWKLKRLHRLIMTSNAYQRSGRAPNPKKQAVVDPSNGLLASFPPRRLTAEELRDGTLLVTGELNRELGGVPIMPEINMEVALQPRMIQFSIAPAHQPSRTPAERNRRTVYAYRVRGQADPFLEILNLPNPNESCEARNAAAVTPQAFTLLNSDMMTDRSIAFALRVQKERLNDEAAWIRRAVQLAYGRVPNSQEQESLLAYLKKMQTYHADRKPETIEFPTQVTRSLVEELTGKPFEFIEKLNVFEDYVPDAKPWTVDADTRALADVCLLLLNSNEFLYVY
jgi:hypothetical protein